MPDQSANEKTLEPLLSHLRVDLPGLLLLPPAFVETTVAAMPGEPFERAAVLIALAAARPRSTPHSDDNGSALKDYFSQKEARANEPWRAAARRADLQNQALARGFL